MTIIVYATSPIDHWNGWIDLKRQSPREVTGEYTDASAYEREIEEFLETAKRVAAEELGWEGDITQGPYLSALPDPAGAQSYPVLGWKQSNNGTTYIATRVPLRHLDEEEYDSARH